jgi:outer membrane PBP1 activator LpoA protein
MLPGRARCRQALHALLLAACLCGVPPAHAQIQAAQAARGDDIASADALAQAGQHVQAARLYEAGAKRLFGWDTRVALLAAREYAHANMPADAERMLGKVRRVRGDDAALAATVRAEIAMLRNDPRGALAALEQAPEPLPVALAADVFRLEGRAAFALQDTLRGIRAYEARARVLATAEARAANYRDLLGQLEAVPPGESTPATAGESERGWLELAALRRGAPNGVPSASQASAWLARYPDHPGRFALQAPPAPGTGPAMPATPPGATAPTVVATPGPTGRLTSIALLLPLSGKHRASGVAVRDGFIAAWLADPGELRPVVRVYDTGTDVAGTYARAVAAGTQFVVGPLLKEELAAVAAQQVPVPTLALNVLSGGQPPSFLYQFGLDPVDEARAAARRIASDGHTRGIALFPANAWGQRLSEAFTSELAATSVTLMATQLYDPNARDFTGPLRAVLGRYGGAGDRDEDNKLSSASRDPVAEARTGPQFAFVAANAASARALKPQLRFQMVYDLPVYSTSDAWDPSVRNDAEMDGLQFPEMPWLLYGGQGSPELWNAVHDTWKSAARGRWRLYAFGHDAYRLSGAIAASSGYAALNGLTGALRIGADGLVHRELDWARVSGGREGAAGSGPEIPAPREP